MTGDINRTSLAHAERSKGVRRSFTWRAGRSPSCSRAWRNLLRASVAARVKRFVHVSSVAVYGDNPPAAARYETAPTRKTGNDYGDLKLEQEELSLITVNGSAFLTSF